MPDVFTMCVQMSNYDMQFFLSAQEFFFIFRAFSKVITMTIKVQAGFSASVRNSIQTNLTKKETWRGGKTRSQEGRKRS